MHYGADRGIFGPVVTSVIAICGVIILVTCLSGVIVFIKNWYKKKQAQEVSMQQMKRSDDGIYNEVCTVVHISNKITLKENSAYGQTWLQV